MWYPISFLVSAAFLTLWFFFSKNERISYTFRQLFLLGFSSYLVNWLFMDVEWTQKWSLLSKDLIIMASAAAFLGLIKGRKALFWLLFVGALVAGLVFYLKPIEKTPANHIDKNAELLLEIDDLSTLDDLQKKYDLNIQKAFNIDHPTLLSDWYTIDIPTKNINDLPAIKKALSEYGEVEENEQITVAPLPSRKIPKTNEKFGINDPDLQHLWGFDAMQMDKLYAHLRNSKIKSIKKARIAILDTGVDAKHEDLKGNYTSIRTKYDSDVKGHGTHCAGIAAAVSNNGIGVASFAPNTDFVEVTSIKVLNNMGMGTQKKIIDGMIEAADNQADVISMSLGAYSTDARQKAYSEAVAYCRSKGAIVVVAAGNSNADSKDYSPANATGVIAVSALQQDLSKAAFSNTVESIGMGLAAPGKDIYSTFPNSKYETHSGTSMAAPYVSGLIGLMKSLHPNLTTEEAYQILHKTGQKTKSGNKTGRLIMPYAAVRALK